MGVENKSKKHICSSARSERAHLIGANNRNKSSKYHGVYFCNNTNKWWVRINRNEKPGSENCYEHEEEAAVVAEYIAVIKYGNKAKRNFPDLSF